jgi:glyoxylase-like metal-dependent hydrolase (beta-lactamase superfamily II)
VTEQAISEVADGVFLVRGSQVNWYLIREGRAVTLVDSGYPADIGRVEAAVRYVGTRPEDVAALLVTHAHTDHIGGANRLHERFGTPMYLHPGEVPHAQRQYLEQISLRSVAVRVWRPRMLRWARHAIAAGGTADVASPHAQPLPPATAEEALDLPGRPVPVFTPGHTSGHTAYLLPGAGAVLTGDALVTSHPTTATPHGPQLIASYFQHDASRARASLGALAPLPARLVLPGHGEPWEGDLAAAIAAARS